MSPETTTDEGPLTAATDRPGPMRRRVSSAERATAVMPPRPARVSSTLPRRATIRAPSSSERAPATTAAAISPWECPTTASGRTPAACQRAARETITANSTGWTTSTRSGSPERRTSSRDQSTWGARASAHWAIRSANTGEVSRRSTAMPVHWLPCPGKTKTTSRVGRAVPRTRRGCSSSRARAASAASVSPLSPPTTTARCSSVARVVAREWPMSSGSRPVRARSWAARARRACGLRAESVQGTTGGAVTAAGAASAPSVPGAVPVSPGSPDSGACSRTTWLLVPLTPKEETAARRTRSVPGHGWSSVASRTVPASQSTWGVGRSACRVGGTWPCRMACTILMMPPTPAAAWVWPVSYTHL